MASRTIDRREEILVEIDEEFSSFREGIISVGHRGDIAFSMVGEVFIFSPGLFEAGSSKKKWARSHTEA